MDDTTSTVSADEPTGDDQEVPGTENQGERTAPEGEQAPAGETDGHQDDDQADAETERAAREAAESRVVELEAEVSRLRRANAAVKGVDVDALRDEVRAEFTQQLVRAEVRAAAAGRLRDPADALALVDTAGLVAEDGTVKADAVADAVAQLVKDKPYLAADGAPAQPAGWGDVGAGPRGSSAEPEPGTPLDRLRRAYNS
ncbi:hypothetical protein [Streptomyces huiliensis]|uniref:hypothetical protein n=1 Tax=Streptomyces huiliensis TaxID=2876027 RepID=UPI001CC16E71|nr:hypothetical protein [Streptomyces huiliensis]MBZ4319531.1 hypothetical protein [Streptomyces huiliensis]